MGRTLTDVMAALPTERRQRIEAETARMADEIMTLREVRRALRLTQSTVAKALDMEQESISRIERRADLLLSTLRDYVSALGGTLKITAEFPSGRTVQIATLKDLGASTPGRLASAKKKQGAGRRPA
ncbi:MAG: helix-turn-helix domain-containing protein [Bosea sp. (in: a-proteobacteria)]